MERPKLVISAMEAEKLLASGEWISEDDLRASIRQRLRQYIGLALVVSGTSQKAVSAVLQERIEAALFNYAASQVEQYGVAPPEIQFVAQRYPVDRGKILKIGPTLTGATWQSFSVIAAVVAVLSTRGVQQIVAATKLADETIKLVRVVGGAWETLTDPKELAVFDVILMLQSQLHVIDYDAISVGNYRRAFGTLGPSTDDIVEALTRTDALVSLPAEWQGFRTELVRQELTSILDNLRARSILTEKNGRWRFAL